MNPHTVRAWRATLSAVLATTSLLLAPVAFAQSATSTLERVSSFEYDADGLLIQEMVEPDRPDDCLQTTYQLDTYGNRVGASAGACPGASGQALASAGTPRTSTTQYAAQTVTIGAVAYSAPAGAFPTQSTNALGQNETRAHDPRHGGVVRLTGPNGGVTTWAYDGFGRKTRENRSDGTYTVWAYTLCQPAGQPRDALCPVSVGPHSVAWYVSEASFDSTGAALSPARYQFHDALERIVRVQSLDFHGQMVVQDTHYNGLGQVSQRSILYRLSGGTPHWTTFTYDALGRAVTETSPDGNGGQAQTRMAYSGLITTVTNPQNQTRTTYKNAGGHTAKVVDHLGNEVLYTHDALGQLVQTNAAGVVTRVSYTRRGHKAGMQDPAMGAWDYAYNAFGELVWQQDSLSQVTTLAYDALGRMTQRTEPDLVSRWYHDKKADGNACGASIGKLCEATADNGYRRLHTYDAIGRPTSTATALDSATSLATVSVAYHAVTGRVASQTWPTGYKATYSHTALGFLRQVSGGGVAGHTQVASLEVLAMDPQGRITQYRQGNNVTTVKAFDQASGQLNSVQATGQGQGAGNVLAHTYGYDKLGNLLTRTDANTGVTESFQYDSLNRLGMYTVLGGSTPGTQRVQMLYDAAGNLKYKSDVGYYHHDAQRPNRLSQVTLAPEANWSAIGAVTQANTGTRTLSYAFDEGQPGTRSIHTANGSLPIGNGNLWYTVSQDQASGRHTVRWESYTSFNMPREIQLGNVAPAQTSTPATLTGYSCPEGRTLNGSTCSWTSTATTPATPVYACPSGFTLSGHTCFYSSSVPATGTYSCDTGVTSIWNTGSVRVAGTLDPADDRCKFPAPTCEVNSSGQWIRLCDASITANVNAVTPVIVAPLASASSPYSACHSNPAAPGCYLLQYKKITLSLSCPSGTTLSGTNCVSSSTQAATLSSYSCPAGSVLSEGACATTTARTEPATPLYTCPAGTSLSGSACLSPNPTATVAERTLSFAYGPEHQRIRQTVQLTSAAPSHMESGTTWYLNGEDSQGLTYEKEIKASGTTEHKHYVNAGGISFALYVWREGSHLNGQPATQVSYFHHDHLGSIAAISNELGQVTERLAYDPWGKRRYPDGLSDANDALYGQGTDRGYTMHEHLDEMGVIHMNGRIYDPLVGRFMSADPFIQSPGNLQSFNRYAYVLNNPLAYTDPSGYFSLKKFFKNSAKFTVAPFAKQLFNFAASQPGQAQIDNFILKNQWANSIGQGAATVFTYPFCGGCGGVIWASYYSYQATGSMTEAAKAGAIVWATQQAFTWAGGVGETYGQYGVAHYGAHALVGCASSVAQGGECGSGAASGVGGLFGTQLFNGNSMAAAIVGGGLGSVAGGGKFANGAVTGAFGYLFNHCAHNDCWGRPDTLQDHFDRHGGDFTAKSATDYAQKAQDFRESALSNPRTEFRIDADGTLRIYDRATNTFGAYNSDGSTKTFYKPGSGERYWDSPKRAAEWGEKINAEKPGNLTKIGKTLRVIRSIGRSLE